MTTPDSGLRSAHLALLVGHHGLRYGEEITYVLRFWCPRDPTPGSLVTTARLDVTCPDCLEQVVKTRERLAEESGVSFPETVTSRPAELC